MVKGQSGGMEHLTRGLPVVLLKEPCVGPFSVHFVTEQREAEMGQVNPNLVGSAGVQLALNP